MARHTNTTPLLSPVQRMVMAAVFIVVASACNHSYDAESHNQVSHSLVDFAIPEDIEDEVIVMCTATEEWCHAATDAFSADTGVKAEYIRLSTGEGLARLKAEGIDPTFDVWYGGPSLGPAAAAVGGFIDPYYSPMADSIPDDLKSGDGLWTGIYVGILGFCSNVEYLADLGVEAPMSYEDLLRPEFDDTIAMADQRTSGTAATAGANLVALLGGPDGALDYLARLDRNIFQYTRSGSAPGRMTAQGETAVSVLFAHDCISLEIETGVDLIVTFPEEGTAYEIGQVSVIANAAHPISARTFVDWALTPRAQEVGSLVHVYSVPTHPEANIPELSIGIDDVVIASDFTPELAETLRTSNFAERFADEVRGGQRTPNS